MLTTNIEPIDIKSSKIVLCLSGGGFRATFYHLGVLKALREHGQLENIRQIYSVSGGSILAAHAVLNWDRYTGSDEQFAAVTRELQAFGERDIRSRVINRYLAGLPLKLLSSAPFLGSFVWFEKYFGRSQTLEAEYNALVGDANLMQMRSNKSNAPQLYMLTTSFSSGAACAFTHNGLISDVANPVGSLNETGNIPVSRAIAASSAFPPLFPPIKITRESVNGTSYTFPSLEIFLTDGGVFDNIGLDVAEMVHANAEREDCKHTFIVSDASAPFTPNEISDFSDLISRTVRTTDILMNRVTETARAALKTKADDAIVHLNISQRLDDATGTILPRDIQTRIARIRTDLDRFSPFEQSGLIQRGFEVCNAAVDKNYRPISSNGFLASIEGARPLNDAIARLQKSTRRRVFRPIFSDKFFWIVVIYIGLVLGLPSLSLYRSYYSLTDDNATLQSTVDRQVGTIEELERAANAEEISQAALLEIDDVYRDNFDTFLKERGIRFLDPNLLLDLGSSHYENGSKGFGKNAYPPQFAWGNIIPAAKALDRLASELREQPKVVSAYRTLAYNKALNSSPTSRHLLFNAIDFQFEKGRPSEWADYLNRYRNEKLFSGGIGVQFSFVQIDGRGNNVNWNSSGSSPTVPSLEVVRPDTKVYIQFAGFTRDDVIKLSTDLSDLGWDVPSFERGGERTSSAAGLLEVKFSPEMKSWVVEAIINDIQNSALGLVVKPNELELIPPGIFEIWISK